VTGLGVCGTSAQNVGVLGNEQRDGVPPELPPAGATCLMTPHTKSWPAWSMTSFRSPPLCLGNRSLLFRDPDGNLVNFLTPVTPAAIEKFAQVGRVSLG
jgi:hypothetical protein